MQSNPSDDFMSLPLEENLFEWQFAIRGPRETEFEGGIYHGRIQLPAEYPFKPPSFMLLSPNGRFETQTKICLSISNHHPEHWQPSWSVRTALVALIAFMPTSPNGALGSLDYTKEERRALAIKSRESSPKFGTSERQKLIDEIHEYMLCKAPPVPKDLAQASESDSTQKKEDESTNESSESSVVEEPANNTARDGIVEEQPNEAAADAAPILVVPRVSRQVSPQYPNQPAFQRSPREMARVQRQADDRLFTWAAVGLTIAIVVLLLKKFMKAGGYGAVFMNES